MIKKRIKLFVILLLMVSTNVQALSFRSNLLGNDVVVMEDLINDDKYQTQINTYLESKYGENYKQKIENNIEASKKADYIKTRLGYNSIDVNLTKTNIENYPDFFGGLYIDDNDKLTIQIVESKNKSFENSSIFEYVSLMENDINIENVHYSYNELKSMYDYIHVLSDNMDLDISAYYIDVINNRVVIETKNSNDEIKSVISSCDLDDSLIVYNEGTKLVNYAELKPGAGWINPKGHPCSYGYRAKADVAGNSVGMVSAAHCASSNATISGIGTVKRWKFSGSIDALWIQTSSGNTPSNVLSVNVNNTNLSPNEVISSFTVGMILGKIGQASGYTSGKVQYVNYGSGNIRNLVMTDFWAQKGDSGGIVFQPINGLNGYRVAGIVHGGPDENGGVFAFSRADYINKDFSLFRY